MSLMLTSALGLAVLAKVVLVPLIFPMRCKGGTGAFSGTEAWRREVT